MKNLSIGMACLLGVALQSLPAAAIRIDANGNASASFSSFEYESRIFPGTHYFQKGNEAWNSGNVTDAVQLWKKAASWGQKSAQYNLGVVYFMGKGVTRDTPLGLAWLGLAAERGHPLFQKSLKAARHQASVEERAVGKQEFVDLKRGYGDEVALKRAMQRYKSEVRTLTGSRVGAAGHVKVYSHTGSNGQTAKAYLDELQRKADEYFDSGADGVNVQELIPFDLEALPAEEPRKKDPASLA